MSLFDDLQKEDGIQRATIDVWGQTLKLRSLNGEEMIDYSDGEDTVLTAGGKKVSGVRLLVATLEDIDGNRVPLADQPKMVQMLIKKDFRQLQTATQAARALNGLTISKAAIKNESGGVS